MLAVLLVCCLEAFRCLTTGELLTATALECGTDLRFACRRMSRVCWLRVNTVLRSGMSSSQRCGQLSPPRVVHGKNYLISLPSLISSCQHLNYVFLPPGSRSSGAHVEETPARYMVVTCIYSSNVSLSASLHPLHANNCLCACMQEFKGYH